MYIRKNISKTLIRKSFSLPTNCLKSNYMLITTYSTCNPYLRVIVFQINKTLFLTLRTCVILTKKVASNYYYNLIDHYYYECHQS